MSADNQLALSDDQLQQLYQFAHMLSHEPADAHDLVQASLEAYVDKARRTPIPQPMAYLRRSIRNQWIDTLRKSNTRNNYHNDQNAPAGDDDNIPDIGEQTLESIVIQEDLLQKIWQQLSLDERELLYYWAILELSTSEIAKELNIPRGTLLSRLHRMRKRLEKASQQVPGQTA